MSCKSVKNIGLPIHLTRDNIMSVNTAPINESIIKAGIKNYIEVSLVNYV
jgi:hypothetical protein